MYVQDSPDPPPTRSPRRRPRWVPWVLSAVFLLVLALRHDYWWWTEPRPLLFGFLPVGLWWQAVVSILACLMMWLMVTLAWPQHLEDEALRAERDRTG